MRGSAALIGIQIGPAAAAVAWAKPFVKLDERIRRIACSGRSVAEGLWHAKRLAIPVVGYVAQIYPAPPKAAFRSQLALQRIMHLPHHGLPPALLRSLPSLGDPEFLPQDLHIEATRALASNRLFPIAKK